METILAYLGWAIITAAIAAYVYYAPAAKNTPPTGLDEASDW